MDLNTSSAIAPAFAYIFPSCMAIVFIRYKKVPTLTSFPASNSFVNAL